MYGSLNGRTVEPSALAFRSSITVVELVRKLSMPRSAVKMENAGLGCYAMHSVYLWYCFNSKGKSRRHRNIVCDRRPRSYRDRNIFVQYAYKPDIPGREYEVICIGRVLVWDSVRRMLSITNHKLLGVTSYQHDAPDWRRFYRLIDAVPPEED